MKVSVTLTIDQEARLATARAAVDKTSASAQQVLADAGPEPRDTATRRRIGRATQKAADARNDYDRLATAWGAPTLPPLSIGDKPAWCPPRSTDEAAIAAAKRDLAEVARSRAADDWTRGRRMGRGKQAVQRVDAQMRRYTQYERDGDKAEAKLRALGVPRDEIEAVERAAWSSDSPSVS